MFLRRFIGRQPLRRNTQFQGGAYQPQVTGLQTGKPAEGDPRSLLVLLEPGRGRIDLIMGGGQGDQPEIQIAV